MIRRAYISYLVVDINQDHILEFSEVKVLLWLIEGVEPKDSRVKREMDLMDKDKSGTISLDEWISYVCSVDPITGNTYFDYELKRKFDKYDLDSSGTIEKEELKLLLYDMTHEMYGVIDSKRKKEFDDVLTILTTQIAKSMDENGDCMIGWEEFKKNYSKISKNLEKLKGFIAVQE